MSRKTYQWSPVEAQVSKPAAKLGAVAVVAEPEVAESIVLPADPTAARETQTLPKGTILAARRPQIGQVVSANHEEPVLTPEDPVAILPRKPESSRSPAETEGASGQFPRGPSSTDRVSYADITAQPCFSHAPDYSWLAGQVDRTAKGWKLRYASLDETDRYGGSVTLTDNGQLGALKDGTCVRVRGRILETDKAIAPPYQVEAIEPIGKN